MYKGLNKEWGKKRVKAIEMGDPVAIMQATDKCLLYDSLQLAHKCILNSFYGYVMRTGARWHSMEMAGITTFTGSNLIREAREFVDRVGLPIELDTDGIWCMLPKTFPDTFKFLTKKGKELKMTYPNSVLNLRVDQKYANHQYQERKEVWVERPLPGTGLSAPKDVPDEDVKKLLETKSVFPSHWRKEERWITKKENSIFFEVDGPYRCMILPASTDEDRMLKKRYCVWEDDGSIAELKGFEMKRRGELKLIQVFQQEIFEQGSFLAGKTKEDVYKVLGAACNRWLDVIDSRAASLLGRDGLSARLPVSDQCRMSDHLRIVPVTVSQMSTFAESMSPCHVRSAESCWIFCGVHVGCTGSFRMHSLDRNSGKQSESGRCWDRPLHVSPFLPQV